MSIEVLLMSDIEHTGLAGDVVHVRDGFARNFLFPKGLAEPVTKNSLRKIEKLRKQREELAKIRTAEAMTKASKLKGLEVIISAKAVDEKNLYGSVSVNDVVAAIEAKGVSIDRTQVQMEESFKELGTFDVAINLTAEISALVKVTIAAE